MKHETAKKKKPYDEIIILETSFPKLENLSPRFSKELSPTVTIFKRTFSEICKNLLRDPKNILRDCEFIYVLVSKF